MQLEDIIYSYAKTNQLLAAIGDASNFSAQASEILQAHNSLSDFADFDIQKRIHPNLTLPFAKSIVMVAMPYAYKSGSMPEGIRGRISIAALGEDYHLSMTRHLNSLINELKAAAPQVSMLAFSDTGPLAERMAGVRCGLGYIGKNGLLHTTVYGSMVFLGYILTDTELKSSPKQEGSCGACELCIKACPTGALSKDGFDFKKCISYLTQKKGILNLSEAEAIGLSIYGCDYCQMACPHNAWHNNLSTSPTQYPLIEDIISMDNATFNLTFKNTAAGWRGKNALRKNAVTALYNLPDAYGAKVQAILTSLQDDYSPVVRQAARHLKGLRSRE